MELVLLFNFLVASWRSNYFQISSDLSRTPSFVVSNYFAWFWFLTAHTFSFYYIWNFRKFSIMACVYNFMQLLIYELTSFLSLWLPLTCSIFTTANSYSPLTHSLLLPLPEAYNIYLLPAFQILSAELRLQLTLPYT